MSDTEQTRKLVESIVMNIVADQDAIHVDAEGTTFKIRVDSKDLGIDIGNMGKRLAVCESSCWVWEGSWGRGSLETLFRRGEEPLQELEAIVGGERRLPVDRPNRWNASASRSSRLLRISVGLGHMNGALLRLPKNAE